MAYLYHSALYRNWQKTLLLMMCLWQKDIIWRSSSNTQPACHLSLFWIQWSLWVHACTRAAYTRLDDPSCRHGSAVQRDYAEFYWVYDLALWGSDFWGHVRGRRWLLILSVTHIATKGILHHHPRHPHFLLLCSALLLVLDCTVCKNLVICSQTLW